MIVKSEGGRGGGVLYKYKLHLASKVRKRKYLILEYAIRHTPYAIRHTPYQV
jgi:hypothetical protein